MEEKKEFEVTILEGQRSWYEILLAAVFFSVSAYLLLSVFYYAFIDQSVELLVNSIYHTAGIGLYSFAMGLRFAMVKDMLIDTDTNRIITRYVVGIFSYDVTTKVNEFEYVSFFKDKDDCFNTNLWCKGNRHYKMYAFEKKEQAYQFSLDISKRLNIDLLDATERGNSKWIETEIRVTD